MLEKVKKDILSLRIRHIEREVSGSVLWASMRISSLKTFLLREYMQLVSIIEHSPLSKLEPKQLLKNWLPTGEKLRMSTARVIGTLTSWLLLLMLVVGLYVVALPLVLSLIGLTAILIRLSQVRIKLRINTLRKFLRLKD